MLATLQGVKQTLQGLTLCVARLEHISHPAGFDSVCRVVIEIHLTGNDRVQNIDKPITCRQVWFVELNLLTLQHTVADRGTAHHIACTQHIHGVRSA